MRQHVLILSFLAAGLCSNTASAVPITVAISDPSVNVTFDGVNQDVDLAVTFTADTDNFLVDSLGFTSDGYAGVVLTYTSVALGLAGATGSEAWDFTYALFGGGQESFVLNDAGTDVGDGAINFGGALLAWNGVSTLAPVGPASGGVTNSGGGATDTIGGTAFVLGAFGAGATISAAVGVPETTTAALMAVGLLGAAYTRRRRIR